MNIILYLSDKEKPLMKKIILLAAWLLLLVCQSCRATQVADSAPLFNSCIREHKIIDLQKGKTYYLKSKVVAGDNIIIRGHGAKIVIPETFPLTRYDNIFELKDSGVVDMEDVDIVCQLGQKFSKRDSTGDTAILSAKRGSIRLKNVNFECRTHYNNVTFIFSTGADVYMNHCKVVNNTWSKQGGILWYMSRTSPLGTIDLKDCYFEHDAMDECMCFSVSGIAKVKRCLVRVNIENCTYYSPCQSPSSGVIILYNHNNHTIADVQANYKKCKFICKGPNRRSIQTLQCGSDTTWHYGKFSSKFTRCEFDYSIDKVADSGILGLLPSKNKGTVDDAFYDFEDCKFNIHNYACLIGDKDGDRRGKYVFRNCQLESDGRLFQKRYNLGSGNIVVTIENSTCKSIDKMPSTERLYAKKSQFVNTKGEKMMLGNKLISLKGCKFNNQHVAQ